MVALGVLAALAAGAFAQERGERGWERQLAAQQAREASRAEAMRQRRLRQSLALSRLRAHAGMPDTMYASTPTPAQLDVSCPALADPDARLAYEDWLRERRDPLRGVARRLDTRGNVRVLARRGVGGTGGTAAAAGAGDEPAGRHALSGSAAGAADGVHRIPYFPSASDAHGRQGFARIVNRSPRAGTVEIVAVDDAGTRSEPLTLSIGAGRTRHFNSDDLESGNAGKGLSGGAGAGQGGWRLELSSALDVEALSYIRTADGFLTAMHDTAPLVDGAHRVAVFNPGSNRNQESLLRLANRGAVTATAVVSGTDDLGAAGGEVSVEIAAGASRTYTASELETGAAPGLSGSLGDGAGKWSLAVESDAPLAVMSLLSSPTGHLTNLSTAPDNESDGVHGVPLFPSASDAHGRQGFVRVANRSDRAGEVSIAAHDDTDRSYPVVTLSIGANETRHFNSDDLEAGAAGKGLSGSTGAGEGDWRLALSSALDLQVLSYIRTTDGFLTAMHDVAPLVDGTHRVAVFNPGSNANQRSLLRIVNAGTEPAEVAVAGTDDAGASPGSVVALTVPAGSSRTLTAQELETGGEGFAGALGDGTGKWSLAVESDAPVAVMSLLSSPTGHLTNLSTAPGGGAETAEEVFRTLISPIVQSKCVACHVEGGVSGSTRLVFATDDDEEHLAKNLSAFESLLAEEDAEYVLNKIQGVSHGGGIQVASGTDEYAAMERFLSLLGEDVDEGSAVTVANLFDGVGMESWRSTLRRAAIVFAGRVPTEAEYASIEGGTGADLRAAVRGLMEGPGFHEFLVRAANDRLLTDRDDIQGVGVIDPIFAFFVDYNNLNHEKLVARDPRHGEWRDDVDFGIRRAPLELIAHVVENDLPYTEVLTADYIMANPMAAEAYGAATAFDDAADPHEFQPSEIVSYYRADDSRVHDYSLDFGTRVSNPGNLATDYPHAGILNTTVFLKRYPTTATNRNRARSRWTYYHFLGLDVEKSASRTTDPVALADRNNPTLDNPACTVCHQVLDPVAGAFQNYDDVGYYRSGWGGLDSLDENYKDGELSTGRHNAAIRARSWEERETVSVTAYVGAGPNSVALGTASPHNILVDHLTIRDAGGAVVSRDELEDFDGGDCGTAVEGQGMEIVHCPLVVPIDIPAAGDYQFETAAYVWYDYDEVPGRAASLAIWAPYGDAYQHGDTWYRDMRPPGFAGELVPDADHSLSWLAARIAGDRRFAEATVGFWWPAIMGWDVAEPPEDGDADFAARLVEAGAQAAEVKRLAAGFRRGFGGRSPYDLKDLLTEIALSRWFRAASVSGDEPVRQRALAGAGGNRLLTPEELSRKTLALTGYGWERRRPSYPWWGGRIERNDWTARDAYGLLYGGIDSGGIAQRARDITPIMAGVAKLHAASVACPIVMKDLYLVAEGERTLLKGVDRMVSPAYEFGGTFVVEAASRAEMETVQVSGHLRSGEVSVKLAYPNDYWGGPTADRDLLIDRIAVWRGSKVVYELEMENHEHPVDCHHVEQGAFHLSSSGAECVLSVPVDIPSEGSYRVEIGVWGDQAGDEPPVLDVIVESDTERSAGARAVKASIADLHARLLGDAAAEPAEVASTYALFVELWRNGLDSDGAHFDIRCDWSDHYYFDGLVHGAWVDPGHGEEWDWDRHGFDRERIDAFLDTIDWSDPHRVARTWAAVLAYLLTDYRYLYL